MAEASKFQIKKGLSGNLKYATPIDGCWYVTTDTHELFACLDGVHIEPINSFDPSEIFEAIEEFTYKIENIQTQLDELKNKEYDTSVTVNTRTELPSVGKENVVYIVIEENALYRWATVDGGTHYFCVGRDYNEIECIYGGEANTFDNRVAP